MDWFQAGCLLWFVLMLGVYYTQSRRWRRFFKALLLVPLLAWGAVELYRGHALFALAAACLLVATWVTLKQVATEPKDMD